MKVTWDIEANNLLNQESIDYTVSPYALKDSFKIHCIVVEEHDTGLIHAFYDGCQYELDGRRYSETDGDYVYILENYVPVEYTHHQLGDFPSWVKDNTIDVAVAHNGINYDHMVVKLYYGMDYSVYPDSWAGKNVFIEDTLVRSKLQNPDRFGGHSLDKLSEKVGLRKIDFRPDIPKDVRFNTFAADMLYYCIRDVVVNTKVYYWLLEEGSGWDWGDSYELEKAVAELVTRQEHRGFKFDKGLAESNVEELDALMQDRSQRVSPVLPKKPATKGYQKEYTPPVRQFLKTGEPSSYLLKFADKIGANITGTTFNYKFDFNGVVYDTPLPLEPLVTEQEADIEDTTHIKGWLVSEFGWIPSEWKDRDLTVNSKKEKLTNEKFLEAIDRYVEQTLGSPFCKFRCEHLKTTPAKLKAELIKRGNNRGLKVLTNPNFTKGQEKELCPNLELLSERFPYARDVVEYHTYRHRRNSILGGGLDWDDEGEAEKGYLASVREDGRIATPADTCGAATSRFKHRVVANIPRVSSLYGEKMRGLFGVEEGFIQIGYDFDSLEARIEGHYCYRYDQSKEYCQSLLMAKPNDIHSVTARKITEMIGREFGRTPAKSTKYASTYGATAPKIAQTIGVDLKTGELVFNAFWEAALPLKKLKDALQKYWENIGGKKFVLGIDKRKVPTRSSHAILNSLFQSAGVICAKRAAVIHDRLLRQEGLVVDFFKEDWKNKTFCQQLIMYHDESQLEVSGSLVKIKTFREEEDAKIWKKDYEMRTGKLLSDIGHRGGVYYVGYCRAGELAIQAVREAGEYYGLNVELTAGYMLGKNWAECH